MSCFLVIGSSEIDQFLCFRILERKPVSNAFVRTTTAVTFFNAGVKVQ